MRPSPPGQPQSHKGQADLLARAIAGHGLGSSHRLPTGPVSGAVFSDLLRIVEHDRLLGAAVEALVDGTLVMTEGQRSSLAEVHQRWLRHALDVEALLIRLADLCDQAGIELRVLKGVALAHLVYPNPSFRVFGDLDVLVPSSQFDAAVELAGHALDGTQAVPELRSGFDREFGKEALVQVGPIELDLHRTFVTGPFGLTIDLDSLFSASTRLQIGSRSLEALDEEAMLLHACYNAALGDYPLRLCSLRDLALSSARLGCRIGSVADRARQWRATVVVRRAAELTSDVLGLDPDNPLTELARLPVPRREEWLLRAYLTPARSYSRPLASLAVIPGVSARLRYARALVAPSAAYLRSRGWTERSHLRRARHRFIRRD